MNEITGTATPLPDGFLCSGVCAGIKEEENRKDLGLISATNNAIAGATYTQNKFPSAHVQYCREITPTNRFRALIVNSGNANAATGQKGHSANLKMAESLAGLLNIQQQQVLTSSTGIIGQPFPINTIETALELLIADLQPTGDDFAEAIMTTDLKRKIVSQSLILEGKQYSIVGFAKGSGMIYPNMATMLAYILTDAPIPFSEIQALTQRVCNRSFNCISVDGDTSTNDSFYLISSNPVVALEKSQMDPVADAIQVVASQLAQMIAADGEGAQHLIEVNISGGSSEPIVRKVLNAVLNSSLVKTAINGNDPNWGRILMAVGNGLAGSQVEDNYPISIKIQSMPVFLKGEPVAFAEKALSELLTDFKVKLEVDLHQGEHCLTGWGCDFSDEYVKINAEYST